MIVVTREELLKISEEVVDMVMRKNHDYGDAWQKHGTAGILVRLSDKSLRVESLMGKQALVVDESVRDTLRDIVGYALLGLLNEAHKGP